MAFRRLNKHIVLLPRPTGCCVGSHGLCTFSELQSQADHKYGALPATWQLFKKSTALPILFRRHLVLANATPLLAPSLFTPMHLSAPTPLTRRSILLLPCAAVLPIAGCSSTFRYRGAQAPVPVAGPITDLLVLFPIAPYYTSSISAPIEVKETIDRMQRTIADALPVRLPLIFGLNGVRGEVQIETLPRVMKPHPGRTVLRFAIADSASTPRGAVRLTYSFSLEAHGVDGSQHVIWKGALLAKPGHQGKVVGRPDGEFGTSYVDDFVVTALRSLADERLVSLKTSEVILPQDSQLPAVR